MTHSLGPNSYIVQIGVLRFCLSIPVPSWHPCYTTQCCHCTL